MRRKEVVAEKTTRKIARDKKRAKSSEMKKDVERENNESKRNTEQTPI